MPAPDTLRVSLRSLTGPGLALLAALLALVTLVLSLLLSSMLLTPLLVRLLPGLLIPGRVARLLSGPGLCSVLRLSRVDPTRGLRLVAALVLLSRLLTPLLVMLPVWLLCPLTLALLGLRSRGLLVRLRSLGGSLVLPRLGLLGPALRAGLLLAGQLPGPLRAAVLLGLLELPCLLAPLLGGSRDLVLRRLLLGLLAPRRLLGRRRHLVPLCPGRLSLACLAPLRLVTLALGRGLSTAGGSLRTLESLCRLLAALLSLAPGRRALIRLLRPLAAAGRGRRRGLLGAAEPAGSGVARLPSRLLAPSAGLVRSVPSSLSLVGPSATSPVRIRVAVAHDNQPAPDADSRWVRPPSTKTCAMVSADIRSFLGVRYS